MEVINELSLLSLTHSDVPQFRINSAMNAHGNSFSFKDFFGLLSSKAFWIEIWRDCKRFRSDRRARRKIFGLAILVALLLIVPVLALAYLALVIGSGAWVFAPFVLPLMWWIRRGARKEFASQSITPQPDTPAIPTPANDESPVREYFSHLALMYAALVARAGSERYLRTNELPEGVEVISRRKHIELLKNYGIWDRMAIEDRAMFMMPDGAWSTEQINQLSIGVEPLRLLRWILRIDYRLPDIGQQLHGDYSISHDLADNPERVLNRKEIVDQELMSYALESAKLFRARCFAELIHRGVEPAVNEETKQWTKDFRAQIADNQNEDLLIGNKLVSESSQEDLTWAMTLAMIRTEFLQSAFAVMQSGQVPDPPMKTIFA